MAIIYSYPPNSNILPTDILVCTSTVLVGGKPKNQTKSISIQNLTSYVNTSSTNNLDQVLSNGNYSLLFANVGQLGLFDTSENDYALLKISDSEFIFEDVNGMATSQSRRGITLLGDGVHYGSIYLPPYTTSHQYDLPDNTGTIALTSDIPSLTGYVPYTGATGDINIGSNSIYTSGGAKLWDDGTVEGTAFQFTGASSSYINASVSTFRNWTLPDTSGTIALTSDIPVVTGFVPYTGATSSVNLGTFNLTANSTTTTIDSLVNGLRIGKGGGNVASNTVLGSDAMLVNVIGFDNTAVGKSALQNNLGDDNMAIGHQALFNNTTGDGNTAIGASALFNNVGGINNIGLGFNARALNAADTNSIVIGYNATGIGPQSVVLGNANILTTVLRGKVAIGTTVPTSRLHVVGLLEYATNALAIAGGLTVGAFYHTGGIVKVVI